MSHQSILEISRHVLATSSSRDEGSVGRGGDSSQDLYEELERLAAFIPDNYLRIFCHRWGLRGHSPHFVRQTAVRFDLKKGTAEHMLERCLWQIARHAHYHYHYHDHDLPAVRQAFGDDRSAWLERAWTLGSRWGDNL